MSLIAKARPRPRGQAHGRALAREDAVHLPARTRGRRWLRFMFKDHKTTVKFRRRYAAGIRKILCAELPELFQGVADRLSPDWRR
jgi:hypothetical protein